MPRSVKIYKFYTTNSINNLFEQLQNNNIDETCVTLKGKKYFPKIKAQKEDKEGSIKGTVQMPIVQIPIMNKAIEEYVWYDPCYFYLNKQKNIAIIQNKSNKPAKLLQNILKDEIKIEEIKEDKETMKEIANQIIKEPDAIIHNPRFEFKGNEGYEGLSNSGFTLTRTRCATTRTKYTSMLNKASVFEPIFRMYQMEGIIENDGDGKLLNISRQFVLSMYVDGDFEYWIKFINKCISPILMKK